MTRRSRTSAVIAVIAASPPPQSGPSVAERCVPDVVLALDVRTEIASPDRGLLRARRVGVDYRACE